MCAGNNWHGALTYRTLSVQPGLYPCFPDSICAGTGLYLCTNTDLSAKGAKTLENVRKLEVPWPPRDNYLINSDIYAHSLQLAIFSACHNGKTYHIVGYKITFSRKTNKMPVLALWVMNIAFVACGKIYTLIVTHIKEYLTQHFIL